MDDEYDNDFQPGHEPQGNLSTSCPTSLQHKRLDISQESSSDFTAGSYRERQPLGLYGEDRLMFIPQSPVFALSPSKKRPTSRCAPPRKKIYPERTIAQPTRTHTRPALPSHASLGSVPYCDEESHVDLSQGCPSVPTTKCAILHKLGMYFGPYGFVCERCHLIYPPNYLLRHISKKHGQDLNMTATGTEKKQLHARVVAHLLASHGVSETVPPFKLPKIVSDPIPGLVPVLSYRCPDCPEPRWFGSLQSLRCHYRDEHKKKESPRKRSVQPSYIIRPYRLGSFKGSGGRSKLSNTVIHLPNSWTPTGINPMPAEPRQRQEGEMQLSSNLFRQKACTSGQIAQVNNVRKHKAHCGYGSPTLPVR